MFQVVSIIFTTFLPLLLWVFPRYAAYYAGVDGQWAVLGVCFLGIFSAVLHGLLDHRFRKTDGGGMLVRVFGNWLGKVFAITYIPGYSIFIAISLFSFSMAVKPLLSNTPRLAIVLAMVVVSTMGALYGIETIGRVAALVLPVTVALLILTYIFVFFKGSWSGIFFHPVSISRSVLTATKLLPMFFGLNLTLMISPYFDHRKQNAIWLPVVSVTISCVVILFIYIGTIRVVGYEGVRVLAHPIDFVMKLVEVNDLLIQRFGIVLIFILTMFEGVFFANHLWGMTALLTSVFDTPRAWGKWFTLSYGALTVVVFMLIPNQTVWDAIILRLLVPLSWLYLIVEPLVKLMVALIRGVGDPPEAVMGASRSRRGGVWYTSGRDS